MTGWLVDTNVLSELIKPQPDARVVDFLNAQALDQLYLSTVVLAEIRCGILLTGDAAKQADYQTWLDETIRPMFAGRVLGISEAIMLRWCLLEKAGRKVGHTCSQPDLLIAATALEHRLTLITRNTKDFQRAGVPLHDPWA